MIELSYKKHIEKVYKIERNNFKDPGSLEEFNDYSMELEKSMGYIYSKLAEVIGYLMSHLILDEIHIHNIAIDKKYQNNKVAFELMKHLISESRLLQKNKICLMNGF